MKKYKVTFNYFTDSKCKVKRLGVRVLEAYDRDHAIMLMAMQRKLILKIEQYEST